MCWSAGLEAIGFFSSRRRHTICYRDWSSDVCSSDLVESRSETSRGEVGVGIEVSLAEVSDLLDILRGMSHGEVGEICLPRPYVNQPVPEAGTLKSGDDRQQPLSALGMGPGSFMPEENV